MTTVEELRDTAREVLASTLDGAKSVALVNFPNHGNPGDPAIWLGTRQLLKELGVRVDYQCAPFDFEEDRLRRAVRKGPVLINGGGNFGDLYAGQQRTRMRAIRNLKSHRIIQLPQSIHFEDPANAEPVAEAIAAHGNVTLMMRERKSMAFAKDVLGQEAVFSPDHALGLGRLDRTAQPDTDILWLTRRPGNPEYVDYAEPDPTVVRRIEWLEGTRKHEKTWDFVGRTALKVNRNARDRWEDASRSRGAMHLLVERTYEPLAWRWVNRGRDFLCGSRVVVTDRLHGHVLSALMGIPHVILDNSYGKVSGTLEAWTGDLPGVNVASDTDQALAIAQRLLEETRS